MNTDYFNEYLLYKDKGLKEKAKEAVVNFVNSFETYEEKEAWTLEHLSELPADSNGRIRNEIFEEILFPVLWNGYNNKKVELMVWLAKLYQNCIQNKRVFARMSYKTDYEIISECYDLEPDNTEVIDLYLEIKVRYIAFSIHEYPYGILDGMTWATKESAENMLAEIPFLRKLDRNNRYQDFTDDYEEMLKKYISIQ
jgi:hypothetical protein